MDSKETNKKNTSNMFLINRLVIDEQDTKDIYSKNILMPWHIWETLSVKNKKKTLFEMIDRTIIEYYYCIGNSCICKTMIPYKMKISQVAIEREILCLNVRISAAPEQLFTRVLVPNYKELKEYIINTHCW